MPIIDHFSDKMKLQGSGVGIVSEAKSSIRFPNRCRNMLLTVRLSGVVIYRH